MCCLRFPISASYRKEVERHLQTAQRLGHGRQVKDLLAILAVVEGQSVAPVALVLHGHEKTGATWGRILCCSLMQDGARYPTSAETKAFFAQQAARLQVVQLPTYAPDDNPIEKLWKKITQQETHRHYFPTFEALTAQVEQALLKFANRPEEILALCSLPTE
jgi:hypothetical protein